MRYFTQNCSGLTYPVVTMGTFDGVHLGHQKLLRQLLERARESSGQAVVITYYHHPLETIHRKTFPYLLTGKEKKEELLRSMGIDCIMFLNFTERIAAMKPDQFLKEIIIEEIGARELVIGYDTHFGRNRTGNVEFLKMNARKYEYAVNLVEPFKIRNRIVSSSMIRDMIREGGMEEVSRYLGRYYSIGGEVVGGQRIGRDLGYPTVNIEPRDPKKLVPAIGVYACTIRIRQEEYTAVTNIGYSPTLKKNRFKEIETHIIDLDENLYGEVVEVFFHKRLRDELNFASRKELIAAIDQDITDTRNHFGV